ncbi:MarR family winged helix-turn-helix transcriptional regulator [Streptomyces sp. NRRL WC-3742]|uniref:MarR family winged helix-turn-helix transcriptional regulator n=1 Tax=Streptomyces sp. NRRL WC-3742 TaxID=1463934 RepID=UPI0004C597A6|nr:MarR family winged helix-turn-helix transcriptional regulator [Streptomyces sp. NRRL WC-3742]
MKPIGYWLNRTDQAITHHMNGVLAEYGLTRTTWQVLNVLRDTPEATDTAVLAALAPNADRPTLTAAIDTTLTHAWTTRPTPGHLTLTPAGRDHLSTVATRVAAFRDLSLTGITPEDYRTTVTVLERMTLNLETNQARS